MFHSNQCVRVCVDTEPRTQDLQGAPDEDGDDGEEQGSEDGSGRELQEAQEEAVEGAEALQWKGPGQSVCASCRVVCIAATHGAVQ